MVMAPVKSTNYSEVVNRMVSEAQDLPSLLDELAKVEPGLVEQLKGTTLAGVKTPWITLVATMVAWLSTKYGFGWNEQTDTIVTGAVLVVISYIMRLASSVPVTGIFKPIGVVSMAAMQKSTANATATGAGVGGTIGMGIIAALLLTPVGCSAPQTTAGGPSAVSIAALGEALLAADQLALAYAQLPACGTSAATTLCSIGSTKAAVKRSGAIAYAAYKSLEAAPSVTGALLTAEEALASYTQTIPPVAGK